MCLLFVCIFYLHVKIPFILEAMHVHSHRQLSDVLHSTPYMTTKCSQHKHLVDNYQIDISLGMLVGVVGKYQCCRRTYCLHLQSCSFETLV